MNKMSRIVLLTLAGLVVAGGAWASNFRVADTVYLNGAIYIDPNWNTSVVIWNPNGFAVDVDATFLPTGNVDNRAALDANFESLGTIPANGVLEFDNILNEVFGLASGSFGHMVVFSCKSGGDCSGTACDDGSADCLGVAVEARVFSTDLTRTPPSTAGQLFVGNPWFSFASIDEAVRQMDTVQLVGIRVEGSKGVSGFRTNIGLVNSSYYSSTTLRVTLYNSSNGAQFGSPFDILMLPLGHTQVAVTGLFPGFTGRGFAKVEQLSFTPTGDADCPTGCPGYYAYGAVIDNLSEDSFTLEPIYPTSDPYLEVFAVGKSGQPSRPRHLVPRPFVNR